MHASNARRAPLALACAAVIVINLSHLLAGLIPDAQIRGLRTRRTASSRPQPS
jgi:hypothetical protein